MFFMKEIRDVHKCTLSSKSYTLPLHFKTINAMYSSSNSDLYYYIFKVHKKVYK